MTRRAKKTLLLIGGCALLLLLIVVSQFPLIGAAMILHPPRRHFDMAPPLMCQEVTFQGEGVALQGWRGKCAGKRRGTLVYLHGVSDNRMSSAGVLERFCKLGYDVISYDSRAHGASGGDACTYGFYEKRDLARILDTLAPGPVVLIGSSLGGAVALQLAAIDKRIAAVVAAESFSDFRTVATERAPWFFTTSTIKSAFQHAEKEGRFSIDAVSPVLAAGEITTPVLLIHGEMDIATPPEHARRLYAALSGPKKLILLPGVGHNQWYHGEIWNEIEQWINTAIGDG
jgi:pimeloyl-ACP methyl ester carboxylesterase